MPRARCLDQLQQTRETSVCLRQPGRKVVDVWLLGSKANRFDNLGPLLEVYTNHLFELR
jgi:hypothetical protein